MLARQARQHRAQVRAALPTLASRQRFWEDFFDSPLAQQLLAGALDAAAVDAAFAAQLGTALGPAVAARQGVVWLIGAGPGRSGPADAPGAAAAAAVRRGAVRPAGARRRAGARAARRGTHIRRQGAGPASHHAAAHPRAADRARAARSARGAPQGRRSDGVRARRRGTRCPDARGHPGAGRAGCDRGTGCGVGGPHSR